MDYTSIAPHPVHPLAYLAVLILVAGCWLQWRQRKVWKLYAAMALTHVGFLLIAVAIDGIPLTAGYWKVVLYYLIGLVLALLGMAVVMRYIQKIVGHDDLRGFAALYYRSPLLLALTTLLLMSLAGLPITPLFWARLFTMLAMIQTKASWLIAISLVVMIMVFPMYFAFFKQMFMRSGGASGPTNKQRWQQGQAGVNAEIEEQDRQSGEEDTLHLPLNLTVVLWIITGLTLVLAAYPGLLL